MATKKSVISTMQLVAQNSSEPLRTALNSVLNVKDGDPSISNIAQVFINNPMIKNEFIDVLMNKIVEQKVEKKVFSNKLSFLEGDRLPLGQIVEDTVINPATGRKFDPNDYAGILKKYEADVKVQYLPLNSDIQYPVTVTDQMLRKAFMSWENMENFISSLTDSLYSGAYIDSYQNTKAIITDCYVNNKAPIVKISKPTTEELAKEFLVQARTLFKDFQEPTTEYNSWKKCGGYGNPLKTWTEKEDILFFIRNDISSYLDVNVLASAFNIDKSVLLGNLIEVKDFNQYDAQGNVTVDGSKILGMIADKSFFKIRTQDIYMQNGQNANNRTWNYYLNVIKMYQFSLFANCTIFAEDNPVVKASSVSVKNVPASVKPNEIITLDIEVNPVTTTETLSHTDDSDNSTIEIKDRKLIMSCTQKPTGDKLKTTVKCGSAQTTVEINVLDE